MVFLLIITSNNYFFTNYYTTLEYEQDVVVFVPHLMLNKASLIDVFLLQTVVIICHPSRLTLSSHSANTSTLSNVNNEA